VEYFITKGYQNQRIGVTRRREVDVVQDLLFRVIVLAVNRESLSPRQAPLLAIEYKLNT